MRIRADEQGGGAVRIDSHHHLWDLSAVHYPWLMERGARRFFGDPTPIQRDFLVDEFRAMASAERVAASVHIQVGAEDPLAEAKWVQAVADANPGWPAAQVAFADLTDPNLHVHLDRYKNLRSVRGIRQIIGRSDEEDAVSGTNALIADGRFLDGLHEIAGRGLRFDLQLTPGLMEGFARLAGAVPELPVVLCHAGSPQDRTRAGLRDWADRLESLSGQSQIYCKLSGLGMFDHGWTTASIAPIVETCLDQFGAGRCMFGSNFPVDSLASSYARIVEAYESLVPAVDHAQVFCDTAKAFYGLEIDPRP